MSYDKKNPHTFGEKTVFLANGIGGSGLLLAENAAEPYLSPRANSTPKH